jgi:transcriptional regulator with XRE-family HTH domain
MEKPVAKQPPKSDVLSAFADRLNELCDDWGLPTHGRQTHLGAKYHVTPNTARKWLLGLGFPEMELCIQIANDAGVNIRWLLQGEGLKKGEKADPAAEMLKEAIEEMPDQMRQASFDFIGYQLNKADGFIAPGKLASYMKLLERLKGAPRNKGDGNA